MIPDPLSARSAAADRKAVGTRVKRLRSTMGMTQEQFAGQLHVTPLTVHRWESGQAKPRRLALEKLRELEENAAAAAAARNRPLARRVRDPAPPLDFVGDPDAVSAVAEGLRLAYGHQFNPAFASEISRIDPLPHQRIAVYEHMLPQDPLRFLLADDAGAGKTIMTGLAVREMLLRRRIRRVLVAPPAGLVGNWERELRTLFQLPFRIATGADVRSGNPFRGARSDLVIVSMDTLAGERVFEALCDPGTEPYDLVVFDEAHKLAARTRNHRTVKTRRYKLAEALAGCPASGAYAGLDWSSRHLLLLTATPHMGRNSPYHFLWRLLDPHVFATGDAFGRFPRRARSRHFIRRTKEEMLDLDGSPLYRRRHCDTFSYTLSPGPRGEQALYDAATRYLRRTYDRAPGGRGAARLVAGVFQRRLASSSWALLRSLERRAERLAQVAEALRSGHVTPQELRHGRSRLEHRHRADYFERHGADEDTAEDGFREAHEDYEAEVLGAVVAVTVEEMESEIATLESLKAHARAIVDSGRESKFEKLREVLEDSRHANEKWLIFTEHRDTMDYLARRLEGVGHAGRVARIHGGLSWRERERQVEHFRDPDGARHLVATDAAGEGINLQFCAFMANYDIPWNPARLEQRMGRIHRYGQKRDVRIVNLVAANTREGRVLRVLLEKLDAVRRELRSDKVFDVIGRLFENASLRDYMIEALTDEGERRVAARVGEALDGGRVRNAEQAEERAYGPPGDVAARLGTVRSDMERERYLQLLPGYVRRFVEKSAALLGLEIRGSLDRHFHFAPLRPGALDPLLSALERYPAGLRERLRVHRPEREAESVWLRPGEPVFDALRVHVVDAFSLDALRGGIFVDPRADAPYLFHLAVASVHLEEEAAHGPGSGARKGGTARPPSRTPPRILDQRLLAMRQEADGEPEECSVEPLLLLRGAGHIAPGSVPLAARSVGMRAEASSHIERVSQARVVEDRRKALLARLPARRRRIRAGFDFRAADLAERRLRLAAGAGTNGEAEKIEREQRALREEKARALAVLERGPASVVPGEVRFVVHALAVPTADTGEARRYDESVEEIAVRIAGAWERERGADVRDVSRPALARRAGLADWPGFDLIAEQADGTVRNIEVKGRAERGAVHLEANEWKQACNLGEDYWLYVVFGCATPEPSLVRVRDPFSKLLARNRVSSAYTISARALIEAAERGDRR